MDQSPKSFPSFTDTHAPRVQETASSPTSSKRVESLLDAYFGGKIDAIAADLVARPQHYGPEAAELVQRIQRGEKLYIGAINDLVLQYTRPTRAAEVTRAAVRRATAAVEESEIAAYERQEDFNGAVKLI